jgi:nucleotide-binding universal stress UspA family protein
METHLLGPERGLEALDAALDTVRSEYPGVPVRRAVMRARAGKALVHASSGAALLVVGDRRLPAVARRLLGSVSRHVLLSAHCPVAVVHGDA